MTASTEDSIAEQARQWSVKLSSGEADKAMLAEFHDWRSADPRHEHAFRQVERVWLGMAQLHHLRCHAGLPAVEPATTHYIQRLLMLVSSFFKTQASTSLWQGAAVACTLVAAFVFSFDYLGHREDRLVSRHIYETGRGEVSDFNLEDGSVVTLGPRSRLRVSYTSEQRLLLLAKGEALFDVVHDVRRPFVVQAGKTWTRVLGTVFTVKRQSGAINVAVKEGKVQVGNTDPSEPDDMTKQKVLSAGWQVEAKDDGRIGAIEPVPTERVGSWKNGKLTYEDISLERFIADVGRYHDKKIVLSDQRAANKSVTISFDVDDLDGMLDQLAEVLALDIDREMTDTIIISSGESPQE